MVDTLTTLSLETLHDLLVEEVKFLSDVRYQVDRVESDLGTMRRLLMRADKWHSGKESNSLHDWIIELRKLASKAEDVLEKYAVEVTSRNEGRTLKKKLKRFACILNECFSVHQVGKEIEDIRSRLARLTDELNSLSGGEGSSSNSADADQQQYLLRLTYPHEVEQHFVGMEKDIERLVKMVKDDQNSPVISICGMGGLGKTSLARKIYNHGDVQSGFKARAWVCVTQQFQAGAVLREILEQVLPAGKEEINNMGQRELVVRLHNVLVQKKCLIVIDDIWMPEHWAVLKPAFQTANCKVVLTTRNENIVSQECVYKLDFLSEDDGWKLLQKIALNLPRNADHPVLQTQLRSLEVIGRHMVQKCGRLPLAISVIGGILRQKQSLAEWENVSSNIDSYLKHGEGVQENKGVKQVLDLSYNTLPYHLKPCFLYLGCFPEDEEIETQKLYLLWIAEGLISSQDKGRSETLRDVAQHYLTELALRCMVQVRKDETYAPHNKFESCRLHDLMRELCTSKAEEDNFLKHISFSKDPYNSPSSIGTSISRLAIFIEDDEATTSSKDRIQKLEGLRSFLVLRKRDYFWGKVPFHDSIIDFDKSKCLRVLALDGCKIEGRKSLSKVDKLYHLRYLGLFYSYVEELPPSICHMPYLQTLDLRVYDSIKLPNVIYKMKRLRHLFLDQFEVIEGDKLKLDGLKELETLEKIGSDKVCIANIPKLTNLRKLVVTVKDMDSVSTIAQYMSNHQSQLPQTNLSIESCDFSIEEGANVFKNILMSHSLVALTIIRCKISCGFPSYQQGMCRNLVALALYDSEIGGNIMEKLGKYPMLNLLMKGIELLETNMIFGADSFPELKSLYLWELPNLEKWEVEERAMPKLTDLWISQCNNLEMIPDGLRFISTLREFITYMPKEFNDKLRVVDGQPGEDYYKISHISSINLDDLPSSPDSPFTTTLSYLTNIVLNNNS